MNTNIGTRKWMVISWRQWTGEDEAYGKLLVTVEGTYDEAAKEARSWVNSHGPIGVCGVIE